MSVAGRRPEPGSVSTGSRSIRDSACCPTIAARCARQLGLPRDASVALVMGGGPRPGAGRDDRARAREASARRSSPVVLIVGKNRGSSSGVTEQARRDGADVRVLGFVQNVYDWMHAADVLVTKPGGLTTSEALAAGLPIVHAPPVTGPGRAQCALPRLARRRAARDAAPRPRARSVEAVLARWRRREARCVTAPPRSRIPTLRNASPRASSASRGAPARDARQGLRARAPVKEIASRRDPGVGEMAERLKAAVC